MRVCVHGDHDGVIAIDSFVAGTLHLKRSRGRSRRRSELGIAVFGVIATDSVSRCVTPALRSRRRCEFGIVVIGVIAIDLVCRCVTPAIQTCRHSCVAAMQLGSGWV